MLAPRIDAGGPPIGGKSPAPYTDDPLCGPLHQLFLYRLVLAVAMPALYHAGVEWVPLGSVAPLLFLWTAYSYLGFVLAGGGLMWLRRYPCEHQAYLMVFLDIPAVVLIMHASGGIETGLGLLLAISIALGSLVIGGRVMLVFAAIASLAILTEQIYGVLSHTNPGTTFTLSGLEGAVLFAVALVSHILSRRLRESEQRVSQRELDLANLSELNEYIIRHMQAGVMVADRIGRIRLINHAATALLGLEGALVGKYLSGACPALWEQMQAWGKRDYEVADAFRAEGSGRDIQATFVRLGRDDALGTLVFLEDAALLLERAQQMKLASLGRLTASIAHEIRNPLGAIGHAGQLLAESPVLETPDRRLTEIIGTNVRRVNDIVNDVLNLSRRGQSHPDEIPLAAWLDAFGHDLCRLHSLTLDAVQVQVHPEGIRVLADPGQLRQVLTNLCENAIYHFPGPRAGLRLRLEGGLLPASRLPYVEVIDNGRGIPPENEKRIFEPFFTTESTGTGLGLYICRELCESNRMRLEYRPARTGTDGGACFRIQFPGIRFEGAVT